MASLQQYPNGIFHVHFRFAGERVKRSLKTRSLTEANSRLARLSETIRLVEMGRLEIPADQDAATFLLADGKPIAVKNRSTVCTLAQLFCAYDESLPPGAKEDSTLEGERIHRGHLLRLLKSRRSLKTVKHTVLQDYVNARLSERHRKKLIQPATVRKEITTLRLIWNWGIEAEHIATPLPTRKLVYPKVDQKPPFMTWSQIEAAIIQRSVTAEEEKELWAALFLDRNQIDELLDHVQTHAPYVVSYPLLVSVAHTGARRSELMRALLEDFDLSRRVFIIREKKKSRYKATTFRHVPMSGRLCETIREWKLIHPGGPFAFCETARTCLTKTTVERCFESPMRKSCWEKVRGFHVFRHSFASNLAAAGIDQRIIDEWMGHQTEEMRRRYRHLFPDQQHAALESVFGSPNGKQPFAATIPIGA